MPVDIEKYRKFINGSHGFGLGTNSKDLRPEYNRVLGASYIDANHVKFYIAKTTCGNVLGNLDENGNIALVICDVMSFECYQFKGKCVKYYDGNAEDQKIVEGWMQEWNQTLGQLGIQDGMTFIWPTDPVIVIELEVTDIFDQTPKVGAGERIKLEKE